MMKTPFLIVSAAVLLLASGCATSTPNGPNILNARAEPQVLVLNQDLQPTLNGEVLVDVKDFNYPVASVEVKFQDLPSAIPLEHVAGSTWRAEFTAQQLQRLAVTGKTTTCKADVIATNTQGDTSTSSESVTLSVVAPETSHLGVG